MRLYVLDKSDGTKIHLKQSASSRQELVQIFGSRKVNIGNHVYDINDISAEASENAAPAMALGGVVGVLGGIPGVIIGGIIGALLGKNADDEDKAKVEQFNRTTADVY
ncbi:hypothetical protein [Sedimenticola hydrogenitrophicus]|uniref:hypothetical protein n=1 Tax=Sedimenticola hydrogenitrophicus TaxID=2967975 RepID=UPI0021A5CA01|nr:hypothetical protein [Sedimenticola hydrogenitrophicus]